MNKLRSFRVEQSTCADLDFLKKTLATSYTAILEVAIADFRDSFPRKIIKAAPKIAWAILDRKCRKRTRKSLSGIALPGNADAIRGLKLTKRDLNHACATLWKDRYIGKRERRFEAPPATDDWIASADEEAVIEAAARGGGRTASERKEAFDRFLELFKGRIAANFALQKGYLLNRQT